DVVLRDRLRDEHGILLSLGRADTAGKLLRVGHMGASARPDFARATISALSQILSRPIKP
ncbi:MAG: alanine--glyoxylate aminotransferase family protein, partial [Pyrinomonadaceae bacterium]